MNALCEAKTILENKYKIAHNGDQQQSSTQFTWFTSTKVQIQVHGALRCASGNAYAINTLGTLGTWFPTSLVSNDHLCYTWGQIMANMFANMFITCAKPEGRAWRTCSPTCSANMRTCSANMFGEHANMFAFQNTHTPNAHTHKHFQCVPRERLPLVSAPALTRQAPFFSSFSPDFGHQF